MFQTIQTALKGPSQARAQHRQLVKGYTGIESGLSTIESLCPAPNEDSAAPIFLLSAGWRSGSTLLQRLIMSDKHVLIWGEPYDECGRVSGNGDPRQSLWRRHGECEDRTTHTAGHRAGLRQNGMLSRLSLQADVMMFALQSAMEELARIGFKYCPNAFRLDETEEHRGVE